MHSACLEDRFALESHDAAHDLARLSLAGKVAQVLQLVETGQGPGLGDDDGVRQSDEQEGGS